MFELWDYDYAATGTHKLMDLTPSALVAQAWEMSASAHIVKEISDEEWEIINSDGIF